jgi:hypothetical protein
MIYRYIFNPIQWSIQQLCKMYSLEQYIDTRTWMTHCKVFILIGTCIHQTPYIHCLCITWNLKKIDIRITWLNKVFIQSTKNNSDQSIHSFVGNLCNICEEQYLWVVSDPNTCLIPNSMLPHWSVRMPPGLTPFIHSKNL